MAGGHVEFGSHAFKSAPPIQTVSGCNQLDQFSRRQPRPQGLLLDDFQNGGSSIRHFENRRGEGPGDEVGTVSLYAQMTQEGNSSVVRVQGVIKTEGYQKLKTFQFYVAHLWIL